MARSLASIAFLLALLFLAGAARAEVSPGQAAPDFEAATLGHETLKLSSLRGKVVLLDFWASWCEPCKKELPLLSRLAPRLRARGIEIVAVNIDDDPGRAQAFLQQKNIHLTVVADAAKKIVGRWEPPKMPSSYVIDRAGVVRVVNGGFDAGDEAKLESQLVALVAR
jgi:cytochrome c biogenesis protein CcmG/thiol:disulfide interchange protein DsbE